MPNPKTAICSTGTSRLRFTARSTSLATWKHSFWIPATGGIQLEAVATSLGVPVEWHEGRMLTIHEFNRHPDYRGYEAIELGHLIAENNRLDARIIGDAARTGSFHPQTTKQVWHLVARFGRPFDGARKQHVDTNARSSAT